MRIRYSTIPLLVGGLLAAGLCAGCQERFTRQRYETIYVGMPDWQVRNILGEPDVETTKGSWSYVHNEPYYRATFRFDSGSVKDKAWSNHRLEVESCPKAAR